MFLSLSGIQKSNLCIAITCIVKEVTIFLDIFGTFFFLWGGFFATTFEAGDIC